MSNLKYFLADAANHKAIVNQLDFIGEFLQVKVNNRVFLKLDSRYADYFLAFSNYFGIYLRLLKPMYGMNNPGKLFADKLTGWLLESGFIKSQYQMSIYYKYAPDGTKQCFILFL